jgi:EAL domain-containing protein (putative c-di-GMP-specific phosphodiesterase class I)/signal transduction histidine kinase/DNA-binding NarL/FixJ family response regulator
VIEPRKSLSRKLYLMVAAAVAAAVLTSACLTIWQETSRNVFVKQQSLFAVAQVFASVAGAATATKNASASLDAMRAIGNIAGLVHARIVIPSGSILAELGVAAQLDTDLRVRTDTGFAVWRALTTRSIEVSVPIVHGGEPVGQFVLVADTSDLTANLLGALALTLSGALIALGAGLGVAFQLKDGITAPLLELSSAMARICRTHQYNSKVKVRSDDEVGMLVQGFNVMLDEISARDRRLENHLHDLEGTVAERTSDLWRAKEAAEAANVAKSEFLATMSHEIRTPMNGMMVMADLLATSELPSTQKRYAHVIAKSGQSLLAIINDILDLSKIEAGKMQLEVLPLDPMEIVDDVICLFAEQARSKQLDLAAYVAPDTPRRIKGDPVRLRQVIGNLVNNALKFTEHGSVYVTVEPDEAKSTLRFNIVDTGIGIPADKIKHLFSPFTQADQSTTRRFGGTGLGLTISKRLVEAMGGKLEARSDRAGSVFSFSMPINQVDAPTRLTCLAPQVSRGLVALNGKATCLAATRYLTDAGLDVVDLDASDTQIVGETAVLVADADRVPTLRRQLAGNQLRVIAVHATEAPEIDRLLADGLADLRLPWPIRRADFAEALHRIVSPEGEARLQSSSTSVTPPRFSNHCALVVDDGAVNREVAREALARLGLRVEEARSGHEALAAVAAKSYDVVFMDGSMPDLDGFETCRRIRAAEEAADRPRVPIIALTADVAGKGPDVWLEAGTDAVLYKPFTLAALGACLAQLFPGESTAQMPPRADAKSDQNGLLDTTMLAQLEELADQGRLEFVQRICGLYLEHAPRCGEEIERALAENDPDRVRSSAHALKSMSYNIGANVLAQYCARVEQATVEEIQGAPLEEQCRLLSTTLQATLTALQDYLQTRSKGDAGDDEAAAAPNVHPSFGYLEPHHRLVAQEIDEGLRRSEFELVYQPVVDRTGEQTLGVEALVRWSRAPRNPLSPAYFIPIAEKTGQIVELGQWTLAKACEDARAWPDITIAVNVSTVQLQRHDFARSIEDLLQATRFDPRRLELEITETAWSKNEDGLIRTLARLQELGVAFSLDDFGSGYSSLTYLRQFPVNKIKIDRAFVTGVDQRADSGAIVKAVISIAHTLGKKIVAEGVETRAEHLFLADAGVHGLQGYLFARPMSAAQLSEWLKQETQTQLAS